MIDVPVADPRAGLLAARDELRDSFERVLESGSYILGEEVEAFEREWAARCSTSHAVGIASGTDALALALRAAGVGRGDEVLVPAMTAIATWMAVSQIGAIPVGVDIDPERRCIDPVGALAALGPRTRAIVAVHLFGQPADVDGLLGVAREAGLPLVEDAAQAHGATAGGRSVGSLGACAAFSFYPTKNLGALGDAGAVTTDDDGIADEVRLLREYGWRTARRLGAEGRERAHRRAAGSAGCGPCYRGWTRRTTVVRKSPTLTGAPWRGWASWACPQRSRARGLRGTSTWSSTRAATSWRASSPERVSAPACTTTRHRISPARFAPPAGHPETSQLPSVTRGRR